jgi:hypothetical protein
VTLTEFWEPRVSRKLYGGILSAALHVILLLVVLSGGREYLIREGDAPFSHLLLLAEREPDRSRIVEVPSPGPPVPLPASDEGLLAAIVSLAPLPPLDAFSPPLEEFPSHDVPAEDVELAVASPGETPATVAMSEAEKAALAERLEQLASDSRDAHRTRVAWQQDGRQYSAVLLREPASDGSALERVIADVSTSDRGMDLTTRVNLRRLAFSQFTQMVDRWDPMVQLHDDEIVGRFHSNSQLKLLHDASKAPIFSGKVTTAARGFDLDTRSRRPAEVFRGGIETRAGRIDMPRSLQPAEWAPNDGKARVHEFAGDTHIRFYRDGSFTWRPLDAAETQYVKESTPDPLYLVAASGATLYVQGTVSGRVLVYSPQKIVIEGNLTYTRDPREHPDSEDCLGLVSDRLVEIASPRVTGPGDLEIEAAIFAGRRFVVRDFDHPRGAVLRIFGSLSAGSLSATEPRYATKVEYDHRFERQRPPGFPSTDRFEAAEWSGEWSVTPARSGDGPT